MLLVGGTSAAFAYTQALKTERSPLGTPSFDRKLAPTCECRNAEVRFRLRLREPDRVSAEIVDSGGTAVRTLADGEPRPAGRLVLRWNGRDQAGEIVPDGAYRLRVSLAEAGRTILYPTTIRVDTVAPRLELVSVRPQELAPGGKARFKVGYRSSEEARPVLTATAESGMPGVVNRGRFWPLGRASINWAGLIDGAPAEAGPYELTLIVVDRFGNRSEPVVAPVTILEGTSG